MSYNRTMHLRLATPADIPAIMQIVRRVVPLMRAAGNLQWDDDYPNPEAFAKDIALAQLWVAELGLRIAGMAALTTDQEPEYAQVGWDITTPAVVVHRLAVHPIDSGDHLPAVSAETLRRIVREPANHLAVDRDAVVVVEHDELAQT